MILKLLQQVIVHRWGCFSLLEDTVENQNMTPRYVKHFQWGFSPVKLMVDETLNKLSAKQILCLINSPLFRQSNKLVTIRTPIKSHLALVISKICPGWLQLSFLVSGMRPLTMTLAHTVTLQELNRFSSCVFPIIFIQHSRNYSR